MSRSTRIPTSCKFTAPKERTAPLTGFPGRGAFFRIQVVFLLYKGGEGPLPSFRFAKCHCPFLSPGGDIFPRPGEVFPLRGSPWQNQQVSSTPVNGRRSQPINPKTLRPCQSLHLRGRWHGEAVTERVSQSELSAGSAERPAYSVIFRRCKKQERRTSCFYEYCTGAGSLFPSIT